MRISDWSSDVCSSDLLASQRDRVGLPRHPVALPGLRDRTGDRAVPAAVRPLRHLGMDPARRAKGVMDVPPGAGPAEAGEVQLVGRDALGQVPGIVDHADRKSGVEGKGGTVRVDRGGRRLLKKKKTK